MFQIPTEQIHRGTVNEEFQELYITHLVQTGEEIHWNIAKDREKNKSYLHVIQQITGKLQIKADFSLHM